MSQVRQNYASESEEGVNKQINLELYACYSYLSMVGLPTAKGTRFLPTISAPFFNLPSFSQLQSFYFERADVALSGFAKYFRKASDEEMEHARTFMKFQNDRGGRIILQDIKKPAKDEWGNGQDAMQAALELEKTVNQALLDLHKIADKHRDFHVGKHFIIHICMIIHIYGVYLVTTCGVLSSLFITTCGVLSSYSSCSFSPPSLSLSLSLSH